MKKQIILISLFASQALFSESLSVITVDANQESTSTEISATKISQTEIENSIVGNGFISSLVETNPNIEVDDISNNSSTAGEITPGKISINDAPFYQNNMQIDGISNDSVLDPLSASSFNSRYDVPGNENESFVDLDLVKEIKVYDSNVPAEYGRFTGGVIDAKTVRAGAKESFKVKYKYTSDSLTNIHTSSDNFTQATTDKDQPKFEKKFYNLHYKTPINDSNGIIFSYSRKESTIPGAYLNGFINKKRENQNVFVKWSHYFEDDSVLDITANYSPYESTHVTKDIKDSLSKIRGGGLSLGANYEKELDFWKLNTNLALKNSVNSRDSLNYYLPWIKRGDKDWGIDKNTGNTTTAATFSKEGGFGDIEKIQRSALYNLKLKSNEFKTGSVLHRIKTGFDFNVQEATYERKNAFFAYKNATSNIFIDCRGNSFDCDQNQQYFSGRNVYQKENTSVNMLSTSAYVDDKLEYKNFELTPGLRVDYNDFLKNVDVSHRLNASVKLFGKDSTVIYGGVNRYYGKSFLGLKLREARLPYFEQTRDRVQNDNVLTGWTTSAGKDEHKYQFSGLKTPYTDEYSIGLRQDVYSARINLKYLDRSAKDKFSRHLGETKVYKNADGVTNGYYRTTYFSNEGSSESKILTLSIGPKKPIKFSFGSLGYKLSTSWKEKSENGGNYDDLDDEQNAIAATKVYYNGKVIDKNKLPVKSDPRNIRMHLNMAFKPVDIFGVSTKINLNSVMNYHLAYTQTQLMDEETHLYTDKLPDGTAPQTDIDVYKDVEYDEHVTLDLKSSFDFKFAKKHHLVFATEINNVFDEVKNLENNSKKYSLGRQFWFSLAYKF